MKNIKTFFLGFVSFVLWLNALANTSIMQLYEKKFTSNNVMMDYYILHTSARVSHISCSRLCIHDQECVAFLFEAETSNCTAFRDYVQCESGVNMKHFHVKTGRQPKVLCECNLAHNSSFVNVALGKPVELSSRFDATFDGGLMVDGSRSGMMPCAHTLSELNPYALIDLEQSYNVFSFYLVNRFDCCSERLHDLKIFVGNDPDNLSVCIDYPDTIGQSCTLRAPTLCQGRYVKLQVFTTEYLHICEVEVYSIL